MSAYSPRSKDNGNNPRVVLAGQEKSEEPTTSGLQKGFNHRKLSIEKQEVALKNGTEEWLPQANITIFALPKKCKSHINLPLIKR